MILRAATAIRFPPWAHRLRPWCCASLLFLSTVVAVRGDEPVDSMREHVEQNGLTAFREAVTTNGWVAPSVPSHWHLTNVAPAGTVESGQAARALGSALLTAVDAWAPSMQSEAGAELIDRIARLIALAQWVGATEGYENTFLAARACDVALTGLARQALDTAIPASELTAQLVQCRQAIHSPAARARILNQEANGSLFASDVDTNEELETRWKARGLRADRANAPPDVDPLLIDRIREAMTSLGLDPDAPEPFASFLIDEQCPPPSTTRNCWDKKRHAGIALAGAGLLERKLSSLEELLVFRDAVGTFPTEPQGTSIVLSPLQIAFDEAWDAHETPQTSGLGPRAALTYEAILAGRFIDEDSRETSFFAPTPVGTTPSPTATVTDTPTAQPTP